MGFDVRVAGKFVLKIRSDNHYTTGPVLETFVGYFGILALTHWIHLFERLSGEKDALAAILFGSLGDVLGLRLLYYGKGYLEIIKIHRSADASLQIRAL